MTLTSSFFTLNVTFRSSIPWPLSAPAEAAEANNVAKTTCPKVIRISKKNNRNCWINLGFFINLKRFCLARTKINFSLSRIAPISRNKQPAVLQAPPASFFEGGLSRVIHIFIVFYLTILEYNPTRLRQSESLPFYSLPLLLRK